MPSYEGGLGEHCNGQARRRKSDALASLARDAELLGGFTAVGRLLIRLRELGLFRGEQPLQGLALDRIGLGFQQLLEMCDIQVGHSPVHGFSSLRPRQAAFSHIFPILESSRGSIA